MTGLCLCSLGIMLGFIGYWIWRTKEVPDSVSSLIHYLEGKGWIWSSWLVVVSVTLMIPLIENLGVNTKFFGFLTALCLIGTAITPIIREDTYRLHVWFGRFAGLFSQVCVALLCPWWLLVWLLFVACMGSVLINALPKKLTGKGLFIIEVLCAVSLYGAILCN